MTAVHPPPRIASASSLLHLNVPYRVRNVNAKWLVRVSKRPVDRELCACSTCMGPEAQWTPEGGCLGLCRDGKGPRAAAPRPRNKCTVRDRRPRQTPHAHHPSLYLVQQVVLLECGLKMRWACTTGVVRGRRCPAGLGGPWAETPAGARVLRLLHLACYQASQSQ